MLGFESEEERSNLTTSRHSLPHPEGMSKLGVEKNQGIFGIPHPSTPLKPHTPPHSSPTPPPPPPPSPSRRRRMVNDIKLPIFKALGLEDLDQF